TPEQRETLDLGSWKVAYNGSEPVSRETLDRFVKAFEPLGFRRETFFPCYGLAETTLITSGGPKIAQPVYRAFQKSGLEDNRVVEIAAGDDNAQMLVGSGQSVVDQQIVIAHPESQTKCRPDEIGEIWVKGANVARGYWNRPDETKQYFGAHLTDTGEGPFLRTGDLGFLKDGELFVTGRLKDLIIVAGRNHYPQDIERTSEQSHPALRPGGCAAFTIEENGSEQLVVVHEVKREYYRKLDMDEVIGAIRQAVSEEHELRVHEVCLIKPGAIPKTSSGKIQRRACKKQFLKGDLNGVSNDRNSTA
ncbi:MAG: AMP-binding protein, partial [bacterium]